MDTNRIILGLIWIIATLILSLFLYLCWGLETKDEIKVNIYDDLYIDFAGIDM